MRVLLLLAFVFPQLATADGILRGRGRGEGSLRIRGRIPASTLLGTRAPFVGEFVYSPPAVTLPAFYGYGQGYGYGYGQGYGYAQPQSYGFSPQINVYSGGCNGGAPQGYGYSLPTFPYAPQGYGQQNGAGAPRGY
jgi:hypothetical protein